MPRIKSIEEKRKERLLRIECVVFGSLKNSILDDLEGGYSSAQIMKTALRQYYENRKKRTIMDF